MPCLGLEDGLSTVKSSLIWREGKSRIPYWGLGGGRLLVCETILCVSASESSSLSDNETWEFVRDKENVDFVGDIGGLLGKGRPPFVAVLARFIGSEVGIEAGTGAGAGAGLLL